VAGSLGEGEKLRSFAPLGRRGGAARTMIFVAWPKSADIGGISG